MGPNQLPGDITPVPFLPPEADSQPTPAPFLSQIDQPTPAPFLRPPEVELHVPPRPPEDPKVEGVLPLAELLAKYGQIKTGLDNFNFPQEIATQEVNEWIDQNKDKGWLKFWGNLTSEARLKSWGSNIVRNILMLYLKRKYQSASTDSDKIDVLYNYISLLLTDTRSSRLVEYTQADVSLITSGAISFITRIRLRTEEPAEFRSNAATILLLKVAASYLERRGGLGYASILKLRSELWTGTLQIPEQETSAAAPVTQPQQLESITDEPAVQIQEAADEKTRLPEWLPSLDSIDLSDRESELVGVADIAPVSATQQTNPQTNREQFDALKEAVASDMLGVNTALSATIPNQTAESFEYDLGEFKSKFIAQLVETAADSSDKLKPVAVNLVRNLQNLSPEALVDFIKQTKKDAAPVDASEDVLKQYSIIYNVLQILGRKANEGSNEHKFIDSLSLWADNEVEEVEDDKPAFTRVIQPGTHAEVLPAVEKHFENRHQAPLLLPETVGENTEPNESIATPFIQGKAKLEKLISDSGLPIEEWKKSAEAIYSYLIYEKNPSKIDWNNAPNLAARIGVGTKSLDPMGVLELIFDDQHAERFNPAVLYALRYSTQNDAIKHNRQILPILGARLEKADTPYELPSPVGSADRTTPAPVSLPQVADKPQGANTNTQDPAWLRQLQGNAASETARITDTPAPFTPFEPSGDSELIWRPGDTEQFLRNWFEEISEDSPQAHAAVPINPGAVIDAKWSAANPHERKEQASGLPDMNVRPLINGGDIPGIPNTDQNPREPQLSGQSQHQDSFDLTPPPALVTNTGQALLDDSWWNLPSIPDEGDSRPLDPVSKPISPDQPQNQEKEGAFYFDLTPPPFDLTPPPAAPIVDESESEPSAASPNTVPVAMQTPTPYLFDSQPLDRAEQPTSPFEPVSPDQQPDFVETPADEPLPPGILRERMRQAAVVPGVKVETKNAVNAASVMPTAADLQKYGRDIIVTQDPEKYKEVFGFTGTILSQPLVGTDLYNYIKSRARLSEASLDEWEEFVGLVNRIEADEAPTAKDKIVLSADNVGDAISKLWQIAKSGTVEQKKRLLSYADEISSRLRQKQSRIFDFYVQIRQMTSNVKESRLKTLRGKATESANKLENALRVRGSNLSSRLIDAGIQEGLFVLQKGKRAARALAHLFAKDEDAQVARDLGQATFSAKPNAEAAQLYRKRLADVQSRIEQLKQPNGIETIKTRTYRPVQNFLARIREDAQEISAQKVRINKVLSDLEKEDYKKRRARRKLEFQNGNI